MKRRGSTFSTTEHETKKGMDPYIQYTHINNTVVNGRGCKMLHS